MPSKGKFSSPGALLIITGCAECQAGMGEPLIETKRFDTAAEARAWAEGQGWLTAGGLAWKPHPEGGEYGQSGQGEVWLWPDGVPPGVPPTVP